MANFFNVALGDAPRKARLKCRSTLIHATLMHDVTRPEIIEEYEVNVVRADSILVGLDRPSLCKIDVEGYELKVLEGFGKIIGTVDVFIVETYLNCLFDGGVDF